MDQSELSYKHLVAFKEGEIEEEVKQKSTKKIEKKNTIGQNSQENSLNLKKSLSSEETDFKSKKSPEGMKKLKTVERSITNSTEMPRL